MIAVLCLFMKTYAMPCSLVHYIVGKGMFGNESKEAGASGTLEFVGIVECCDCIFHADALMIQ